MPDTSMPEPQSSSATLRASAVRWRVMSLITLVGILTYLDRLNLSIAGKSIQDEFHLSTQTMGWVFSAFLLGYFLLQVPGGWAGDRFGPRNVLTAAIVGWSVFTAATGAASYLPTARWFGVVASLMMVRILVGVGEAAAAPNANKVVANWIGSHQRGFGACFNIAGIGIGGALTPPLIAWVMIRWGWRSSFYICGGIGILVAILWRWYVTDSPEEHRSVNVAERALIRASGARAGGPRAPTPWRRLLSSRSAWGLMIGYMCQGFPVYFYHTWFFIYLVRVRHLTISEGGLWGSTPYLAIALLAPLGGWFSDFGGRRFGKRIGRRMAIWTGMILSAILLFVGSNVASTGISILLLAAGGGLNMFAATVYWATAIDLTEEHAGALSGLMNMFGNAGGWLSPIVTAYLATHYSWNAALDCAAVVTLGSAVAFAFVNAGQSLDVPRAELSPAPVPALRGAR